MNLLGGHVYKHINCLDMCLYVVKRQYTGLKYGRYKVMYVDYKCRLLTEGTHTVKIQHKDLGKWKYVGKN